MRYLTPILVRNDCLNSLKKEPTQVVDGIINASLSNEEQNISIHYRQQRKWWQFWKSKRIVSGMDLNPMYSLGCRHADTDRLILISGNTWIDLSTYAFSTERRIKAKQDFLRDSIKIAQRHLAELKKRVETLEK